MKQGPLFRRQFFVQRPTDRLPSTESGSEVEYLRLSGHSENPGTLLHAQRVYLAAGGTLDVVVDARGGLGLGRVSYGEGLRAAIKRGDELFTYRFEVPLNAPRGASYRVTCFGHDALPSFQFSIEVGSRP